MPMTTSTEAHRASPQRFAVMRLRAAAIGAFAILLLAACSPEPTPAEPTPLPEDEPAPQAPSGEATELRDAIQQPIEKARAVEDTLQQAADAQAKAIEAAESPQPAATRGD